ncbi:mitochondrial phosphate carrier protein [Salix suchowensis]|nr:mitochondrial phosphate carrier protein [Salix suchowensis]
MVKDQRRLKAQDCRAATGYYALCGVSGMLSAGTTHLVITPLDVLKVNMQVNPVKYYSIYSCFTTLLREQGPSAFWRGWAGKFFGYGAQGGCRFGLYEYFKTLYSNVLVDSNRSFIFFMSSASAEVFANLVLCPFEAVKVRVQAQPHFAKGLADGFQRFIEQKGFLGKEFITYAFILLGPFGVIIFYRGLVPLWGRNLPFSMVMFSTFEHSVDFLYRNVIKRRKEDCSRAQQLGVTCLAGYTAGSVGSFISNPADNIVASLYNKTLIASSWYYPLFKLCFRILLFAAVRKIGFSNLFTRSLPIRIMLVGPVVTLQWLSMIPSKPTSGEIMTDVKVDGADKANEAR